MIECMSTEPDYWQINHSADFNIERTLDDKKVFVCVCLARLSSPEEECGKCGTHREIDSFLVLEKSYYLAESAGVNPNTKWYHSSKNPLWIETVTKANVPIHIGEKTAALDILKYNLERTGIAFLHTVSFKPQTKVAPHLCPDLCSDWPMTDVEEFYADLPDHNAVRYINGYESPGTISVFLDPNFLDLLETIVYVEDLTVTYGMMLDRVKNTLTQNKVKLDLAKNMSGGDVLNEGLREECRKESLILQNILDFLTENEEAFNTRKKFVER